MVPLLQSSFGKAWFPIAPQCHVSFNCREPIVVNVVVFCAGASHENAKAPLEIKKPMADVPQRRHSAVSGGGASVIATTRIVPRTRAAVRARQGKDSHEHQTSQAEEA
jgi:hypothetical protein